MRESCRVLTSKRTGIASSSVNRWQQLHSPTFLFDNVQALGVFFPLMVKSVGGKTTRLVLGRTYSGYWFKYI
jgi:hypothetical protein